MESRSRKSEWLEQISEYFLPTILILGLILILNLLTENPVDEFSSLVPEEKIIEKIVGYVVMACELAAVFVIGTAAIHALISYIRRLFDRSLTTQIKISESIRLRFGHKLSLGLEFAVASDILRLAVSPSSRDIIILFAIVLLRILLNYFLEHDIHMISAYNLIPELAQQDENESTVEA